MNIIPNQFTSSLCLLGTPFTWERSTDWFFRYVRKNHDSGGAPITYIVCCFSITIVVLFFWDPGFTALDLIINNYYMLSCAVKDALQHVPKMSSGYSSSDTKQFFHALSYVCRRRKRRGQSPWRLRNKHIYLKFKNRCFKVCFKHIQNESNLRKILLLLFIKFFVN